MISITATILAHACLLCLPSTAAAGISPIVESLECGYRKLMLCCLGSQYSRMILLEMQGPEGCFAKIDVFEHEQRHSRKRTPTISAVNDCGIMPERISQNFRAPGGLGAVEARDIPPLQSIATLPSPSGTGFSRAAASRPVR